MVQTGHGHLHAIERLCTRDFACFREDACNVPFDGAAALGHSNPACVESEESMSLPSRESPSLVFHGEAFAPWCEKARWAMDHHSLAYHYREHIPVLGEWALRRAAGRYAGKCSVPLLVTRTRVIMDSYLIARKADELGSASSLFPAEADDAVQHWNRVGETIMQSGRALLLARLLLMDDALAEQVPGPVPAILRPLLPFVARSGVRYLARKYHTAALVPLAERQMGAALEELRAAVARSTHLVARRFTFADIATVTALQFVEPVADRYIPLGSATRRAWTDERFRQAYGDLLEWRDELYALYRSVLR